MGELPFESEAMPVSYPDVCFIVKDRQFMCHKVITSLHFSKKIRSKVYVRLYHLFLFPTKSGIKFCITLSHPFIFLTKSRVKLYIRLSHPFNLPTSGIKLCITVSHPFSFPMKSGVKLCIRLSHPFSFPTKSRIKLRIRLSYPFFFPKKSEIKLCITISSIHFIHPFPCLFLEVAGACSHDPKSYATIGDILNTAWVSG